MEAIAQTKAVNTALATGHYTRNGSVYTCNLPGGERLNLAQIRSLQFEEPPLLVMVIWANGDRSIYRSGDALELLMAWDDFADVHKSSREEVV